MVFLKSIDNKTLVLNLDPDSTTLETLTRKIQEISGLPPSLCHIYFLSRRLIVGDATSLASLGVKRNSTITLHLPFFGGTPPPPSPPNYVPALGHGATWDVPDPTSAAGGDQEEEDDEEDDENQMFDDFEGNDAGLLASAEYDDEDMEADAVWKKIDNKMDLRRKDRREARLKLQIQNPTEQFANLKRKLHIPESGNYSLNKRWEDDHVTDLTALGKERERVLSLKLDQLSDSVSGLTVVDPKGYLTDLDCWVRSNRQQDDTR